MSKYCVGRVAGLLTIESCIIPSKKNNGGLWRCKCECGNFINVKGHNLHWRKSCGCLLKAACKINAAKMRKPENRTIKYEYTVHKGSAKKRRITPLSREDWHHIAVQDCFYCGLIDIRNKAALPSYRKSYGVSLTKEIQEEYAIPLNGIDRIDSSIGYTIENSVACCSMCNRMKNHYDLSVFLEKIRLINLKHCEGQLNLQK